MRAGMVTSMVDVADPNNICMYVVPLPNADKLPAYIYIVCIYVPTLRERERERERLVIMPMIGQWSHSQRHDMPICH
jgi:hypothetical protein